MRACERCGQLFSPQYQYAKLCYPCWKRRKDAELLLDSAEREIDHLRRILAETERRASVGAAPEPIPADLLKVMLLLCHPDRHGNSAASTKATTWLLQQRERQSA